MIKIWCDYNKIQGTQIGNGTYQNEDIRIDEINIIGHTSPDMFKGFLMTTYKKTTDSKNEFKTKFKFKRYDSLNMIQLKKVGIDLNDYQWEVVFAFRG